MQQLQQEGAVQVSALAATLDVNPVTIRRDLAKLAEEGRLRRVHGGALLREERGAALHTSVPKPWEQRIAEAAVRCVTSPTNRSFGYTQDDNGRRGEISPVLFIGPGVLTVALVPFLRDHAGLTIITNALDVAWNVARLQQHTLHLLGGEVAEDYGMYRESPAILDDRKHYLADWVILEAGGLDAVWGLTHDREDYARMARGLFKLDSANGLGAQVMVLLPPERVGRAGALHIAPAEAVHVLVTGREAPDPPLWNLSELGVRVVLT
jgi:DeoR/GlpR family transcriptional regulator of sugar metabolism